MKDIFNITKFYLKLSYSFQYFILKFKTTKRVKVTTYAIAIAILLNIPSIVLISKVFQLVYQTMDSLMQASYFVALGYFATSAIILFFGTFMIVGTFYFSKDIETMLSMPVKPRNLILSKFLVLCTYEYIISAFLFLPFIIVYGINVNASFLYYIYGLFTYLLLPIIPLGIAGILVVFIMRFTNIARRRDLLRGIALFAVLFLIFYVQVTFMKGVTQIEPGKENEFITNLFSNNMLLIQNLGKYYPPAMIAAYTLVKTGWDQLMYFGLYVLTSLGILVIFTVETQWLYIGGLIGGKEVISKKKELSSSKFEKETRVSPKAISVFWEDFKIMLRTPMYLFNCLSIVVLIPVLLLMTNVISGVGNSDFDIFMGLLDKNLYYFIFGYLGVIIFFSGVTPIASTTFSREGEANWILRVAPIQDTEHIFGRLLAARIANVVFIVFMNAALMVMIGFNFQVWFYSIIGGIIIVEPVLYSGLYFDLNKPMFHWKTPTQAVKQNLNVIINMGITFAYGVVLGGIIYGLYQLLDEFIIIFIIIIILSIIVREVFKRIVESKFEDYLIEMD